MLIWGLTFGVTNTVTATLALARTRTQDASIDSGKENANRAFASNMYAHTLFQTTAARVPSNIIQVLVGLYLCRRYHRLLNWLMKDIPTI